MKVLPILTMFALLSACSSDADRYRAADYRVLCDLSGRAFVSNPSVGDNSVVTRAPDADEACEIAGRVR
jgi:hypothetical protein